MVWREMMRNLTDLCNETRIYDAVKVPWPAAGNVHVYKLKQTYMHRSKSFILHVVRINYIYTCSLYLLKNKTLPP